MTSQSYHPCEGCGSQVSGSEELCGPCSGQSIQSYGHAMRALRAEARKIRASSRDIAPDEEGALLYASAGKIDEVADFIRDTVFMDAADPQEPAVTRTPITCSKATRRMDRAATVLLVLAFGCLLGIPFLASESSIDYIGGLLLVLAVLLICTAVVITVTAPASKEVSS